MKNTIPTAEEFALENMQGTDLQEIERALIGFAKIHVEAALQAANKNKKIELFVRPDRKGAKYKKVESGENYDIFGTIQMWKVNKDSILNSYPLTNIK